MIRIDTIGQLLDAWRAVAKRIHSDLLGPHSIESDPVGTFARYGFDLSASAEAAFRMALP